MTLPNVLAFLLRASILRPTLLRINLIDSVFSDSLIRKVLVKEMVAARVSSTTLCPNNAALSIVRQLFVPRQEVCLSVDVLLSGHAAVMLSRC